jgi:hypothetical protein
MQFVLVSFTLSVREGDLPSEYLEASLDVLRRYAAGAFSETRHMVTEGGETSLWAAASLERGMTANRLHVQGAALVRYSLEIIAGTGKKLPIMECPNIVLWHPIAYLAPQAKNFWGTQYHIVLLQYHIVMN